MPYLQLSNILMIVHRSPESQEGVRSGKACRRSAEICRSPQAFWYNLQPRLHTTCFQRSHTATSWRLGAWKQGPHTAAAQHFRPTNCPPRWCGSSCQPESPKTAQCCSIAAAAQPVKCCPVKPALTDVELLSRKKCHRCMLV